MEMLKVPAGRLATVFYKAEPQDFSSQETTPVDSEKGSIDGDVPPYTFQSKHTLRMASNIDYRGQVFAWRDISLDIKTKEGEKRLLDGLDGKALGSRLCITWTKKADTCRRLGQTRSDESINGRIWCWQG